MQIPPDKNLEGDSKNWKNPDVTFDADNLQKLRCKTRNDFSVSRGRELIHSVAYQREMPYPADANQAERHGIARWYQRSGLLLDVRESATGVLH